LGSLARVLIKDSVMPSDTYSFSARPVSFTKGMTAIELISSA
jgi:hypothetical protein